ncbi:hypothetical protein HY488_01095 [Candidatus Woesearchaeota archaeon]|nr:hypothetical protein [Candidatus Woesearchaeota archaeon]
MPDPNQPQLTEAEQRARNELAQRKEFIKKFHDMVEPFAWDKLLQQLATFESHAEKGVKGDVRKDREWAEKFINTEIRGPGYDRTDFGGLFETMEVLPVPGGEGPTPTPSPTQVTYPPDHERYPENVLYQHTDGKWYIKKAGELFTVTPDGIIRNNDGWPVGNYNFTTKEINWQTVSPIYPPKIKYAKAVLAQCSEAMGKIQLDIEKQEEELQKFKGVEDILIRKDTDILTKIATMKTLYVRHRAKAKDAQAQKQLYPSLHDELLRLTAEIQEISKIMRDSVQPLYVYHRLLETSRLDVAIIHKLTEQVKVLDTVVSNYPVMRAALFEQVDDTTKALFRNLNILNVTGMMQHLEDSIGRKKRFAAELTQANLRGLRDYISAFDVGAKMLVNAIKKNRFNYDDPDLVTAIQVPFKRGQPILAVLTDAATASNTILVNIEKIEDKIFVEIHADRMVLNVLLKSFEKLEAALAQQRSPARSTATA